MCVACVYLPGLCRTLEKTLYLGVCQWYFRQRGSYSGCALAFSWSCRTVLSTHKSFERLQAIPWCFGCILQSMSQSRKPHGETSQTSGGVPASQSGKLELQTPICFAARAPACCAAAMAAPKRQPLRVHVLGVDRRIIVPLGFIVASCPEPPPVHLHPKVEVGTVGVCL